MVLINIVLSLSIILVVFGDTSFASLTTSGPNISIANPGSSPTTTYTVSPIPLASEDVPRCLSSGDLRAAKLHDCYPLCNVDISGQDIYPFIWAGNFDICLEYCDAFNRAGDEGFHFNGKYVKKGNIERGEKVRCKAALFVPTRVLGNDDCYLKWGLHGAIKTEGKLWIVGGVKRRDQDEEGDGVTANGTMTRDIGQNTTTQEAAAITESEQRMEPMTTVAPVSKEGMGANGGDDKDWLASILTLSTKMYST